MIVKHVLTDGTTFPHEHPDEWRGDIDAWLKRHGLLPTEDEEQQLDEVRFER